MKINLKEFFKADRFAAEAGAVLTEANEERAVAQMTVTARHLNAGGVCQGGALFTLADLACAAIANSHELLTLSAQASITFYRPAPEGETLTATATEVHPHHKLPFIEVSITDSGHRPIALFSSLCYRKDKPLV